MTTMYKVEYGSPTPVEVQAEVPEYPNRDSNGDTTFKNTHFVDLDEAWDQHLREHRAGLSLGACRVQQLRDELRKRETELATEAIVYDAALKAYEEFKAVR